MVHIEVEERSSESVAGEAALRRAAPFAGCGDVVRSTELDADEAALCLAERFAGVWDAGR